MIRDDHDDQQTQQIIGTTTIGLAIKNIEIQSSEREWERKKEKKERKSERNTKGDFRQVSSN